MLENISTRKICEIYVSTSGGIRNLCIQRQRPVKLSVKNFDESLKSVIVFLPALWFRIGNEYLHGAVVTAVSVNSRGTRSYYLWTPLLLNFIRGCGRFYSFDGEKLPVFYGQCGIGHVIAPTRIVQIKIDFLWSTVASRCLRRSHILWRAIFSFTSDHWNNLLRSNVVWYKYHFVESIFA